MLYTGLVWRKAITLYCHSRYILFFLFVHRPWQCRLCTFAVTHAPFDYKYFLQNVFLLEHPALATANSKESVLVLPRRFSHLLSFRFRFVNLLGCLFFFLSFSQVSVSHFLTEDSWLPIYPFDYTVLDADFLRHFLHCVHNSFDARLCVVRLFINISSQLIFL